VVPVVRGYKCRDIVTGVYWISTFEILEQYGFEQILAKARYPRRHQGGRLTSAMLANCRSHIHTAWAVAHSAISCASRKALLNTRQAHNRNMQKKLMETNL